MSNILHRKLDGALPKAIYGEGAYLFDEDGKRYLDASGGAAVASLGHSHPTVVAAVVDQIKKLPSAHTSFFTSLPSEELAAYLVEKAPAGITRFLTVSDGSVAVETAIKLARQYWLEREEPQRRFIISRKQSYHGNTLGALSVSGNKHRREPYAPLLSDNVRHVDPCFAYRYKAADETLEAYGLRAADFLEQEIQSLGPDNVCAFIAETVVGATAGCVTAAPGYFKRIREICDRHGVLLILDEIMCGMGRTGTLFACEQEGVVPDLVTVAKGLGGGYQPIGGVFVSEKVVDAIRRGSNALANGHTYMGHSVACAAALAVQRAIEREELLPRVTSLGHAFGQKLKRAFAQHPHVGDIRGRGLFWALELVRDRTTKGNFEPSMRLSERIKRVAMEQGLLCYPAGGTVDGVRGDHILFAPPFIVTESQLDDIVYVTACALDQALASLDRET